MKKEFAVIGLGRFGGSICKALSEEGVEVMAMDIDEDKVNEYAKIASHAVIGDSTDESVLKNLGLRNFDHVIVAIGENIQASILTTLILKELGVHTITVKAQNDYHEKVLSKIGADHIVHPEREDAEHHPRKNVLTKALGTDQLVSIDTRSFDIEPGDKLLLCSDGLTNKVEGTELKDILQSDSAPQEKVNLLVDKANQNGGEDNITAVLLELALQVEEGEDQC